MEVNGLIKVRNDTTVVKSVAETPGKVTERLGSIRMSSWMEHKCNSALFNNVCHWIIKQINWNRTLIIQVMISLDGVKGRNPDFVAFYSGSR